MMHDPLAGSQMPPYIRIVHTLLVKYKECRRSQQEKKQDSLGNPLRSSGRASILCHVPRHRQKLSLPLEERRPREADNALHNAYAIQLNVNDCWAQSPKGGGEQVYLPGTSNRSCRSPLTLLGWKPLLIHSHHSDGTCQAGARLLHHAHNLYEDLLLFL